MNHEQPVTLQMAPSINSRRLILVLGLVAMVSGLLIVMAYQATLPTITEQKRQALQAAVGKVLPNAVQIEGYVLDGETLSAAANSNQTGQRLFAGYDAKGTLIGIALEGAGQGYADTVKILYGYSPVCECITGFTVVASRETPGFGDKLTKDAAFLANFTALDARLNEAKSALANAIVTVKHGTKNKPWQVDAISGATVSSRAVGRAVNDSATRTLPVLVRQLDQLQQKKP